jgi:hypothetical protein
MVISVGTILYLFNNVVSNSYYYDWCASFLYPGGRMNPLGMLPANLHELGKFGTELSFSCRPAGNIRKGLFLPPPPNPTDHSRSHPACTSSCCLHSTEHLPCVIYTHNWDQRGSIPESAILSP